MTPLSPSLTAVAVACAVTTATAALASLAPAPGEGTVPPPGPGPVATAPGGAGTASTSGTATATAGPRRAVAVPGGGPGRRATAGPYRWPLTGDPPVLRGFAPGPHPWSRGHRGVDLGADDDAPVRAAGAGVVTFAGMIAGRGVVVVQHGGGLRTTYEPVLATVTAGRVVAAGDQVGVLQDAVRHCTTRPCLHWGARIGEAYLDPLLLLRGRPQPPVLLPVTGVPD